MDELTPDQPLYQRVKKLGDYGLLDPEDKAVLDEGKIVTRLELAFYTEKAKARITKPQLGQPSAPTPTPQPIPTPLLQMPTPTVNDQVRREIDSLLQELKKESAALKTQWSQQDQRIKDQQKELDALNAIQDRLNENFKKADNKMTQPTFDSLSRFSFENISLTGSG